LHTTYTCAFKRGFLMSHNWLHTPDCKVLSEMNILTGMISRIANSKAAEKNHSWRLLLTVRARLTVLTASRERKHNACRAEIGVCLSGYTCINKFQVSLFRVCVCIKLLHLNGVLAGPYDLWS